MLPYLYIPFNIALEKEPYSKPPTIFTIFGVSYIYNIALENREPAKQNKLPRHIKLQKEHIIVIINRFLRRYLS